MVTLCVGTDFLRHFIEVKIEGRKEVKGRQGRRRKQLLDDFKEKRGYCKFKEESPDCTVWRNRFRKSVDLS